MSKPKVYIKNDNKFTAYPEVEILDRLEGGLYDFEYDAKTGSSTFIKGKTTHDGLVDLPGTEYEEVIANVKMFFSKECKDRFLEVDLLHKMNIMLYGIPGTGKSSIINRVIKEVISFGGIVLFNPSPRHLPMAFYVLDSIQPETHVLVIFEEVEKAIESSEGELLTLLDGELQKHNAMYIATTNFIEEIPPRILRPGRFPLVVEVGLPNKEARRFYLSTKLKDKALVNKITDLTDKFTIDEVKEVVRAVYCMQHDLDKTIKKLKEGLSRRKDRRDAVDGDYMEQEKKDFMKQISHNLRKFGK